MTALHFSTHLRRGTRSRRGTATVEAMVCVAVFGLFLLAALRLAMVQVETVRCLGAARLQADVHRQKGTSLSSFQLRRAFDSRKLERGSVPPSEPGPSPSLLLRVIGMLRSGVRWVAGSKTFHAQAQLRSVRGALNLPGVTVQASATTVEGCWNLGDVKRFAWGLFRR